MRWPVAGLIAVVACTGRGERGGYDTVSRRQLPPPPHGVTPKHQAAALLGGWFVVHGARKGTTWLISTSIGPDDDLDTVTYDVTALEGDSLQLFGAGVARGVVRIDGLARDTSAACPTWPSVAVSTPNEAWDVGFRWGLARVAVIDSTRSAMPGDSLRNVSAIARLASAAPGDTASLFRGRPYVVKQAMRIVIDGRTTVIAEVLRTVNQEATPLQEHLLLIGERARDDHPWALGYSERTIAPEERAEATDILAALQLTPSPGEWLLLLSRDYGEARSYALIGRDAAGDWHHRWESATAGC